MTHAPRPLTGLLISALLLTSALGCDDPEGVAAEAQPTPTPTAYATPTLDGAGTPLAEGAEIPAGAPITPQVSGLDFGLVAPGALEVRTIILTNTSDAEAEVLEALVQGHEAFEILDPLDPAEGPLTLAPGESVAFSIAFTPDWDQRAGGQLVVHTTGGMVVKVALTGECHSPLAEILPGRVDLVGTLIDCPTTAPVLIHNAGHEALIIDDLFMESGDNPDLSLTLDKPLPLTLAPGERLTLGCPS